MKKRKIEVKLERISPYDFDSNLDWIIARLQDYKKTYPEYEHLYLDYSEKDTPYDDGMCYYLYGTREETDAEYEKRITQEKATRDLISEKERKEYERLKKKFEGK